MDHTYLFYIKLGIIKISSLFSLRSVLYEQIGWDWI